MFLTTRLVPRLSWTVRVKPQDSVGLLRVARRKVQTHAPNTMGLGQVVQYHFRDNTWWELRVRPWPGDLRELYDVWLEMPLQKMRGVNLIELYGGSFFAISKRALSPREVKQLLRTWRERRRRPKRRSRWHC